MKFRFAFVVVAAMLISMFGAAAAQHDHSSTPEAGDHNGHGDHMSATPGSGTVSTGAFYFTVSNNSDEADRLVSVDSDIAEVIEIHEVTMNDGAMSMSPQHDGVEVPANGELVLEPSGYHVMLIGINKSLIEGEEFTATLHFEHAGDVEVTVPIFGANPTEDELADSVEVGDTLEVSGVWARQAPKLDSPATPAATPEH